jgi:hypothetical protein
MLGLAVENRLSSESDLQVIIVDSEDRYGLLQSVARYQPGTIILDQSVILEDSAFFVSLLEELPELRVIGISVEDNWLHMYCKREVEVTQAVDLTEIVRSHK